MELTSSSIRATLRQRSKVVALGRAPSKKATQLDLTPSRELTPGIYKLTLSFRDRHGHRRSIVKTIKLV